MSGNKGVPFEMPKRRYLTPTVYEEIPSTSGRVSTKAEPSYFEPTVTNYFNKLGPSTSKSYPRYAPKPKPKNYPNEATQLNEGKPKKNRRRERRKPKLKPQNEEVNREATMSREILCLINTTTQLVTQTLPPQGSILTLLAENMSMQSSMSTKPSLINSNTQVVSQNTPMPDSSSDNIEIQHVFKITPVQKPIGYFLRHRIIENRYIKLKSFVKYTKNSCFDTKIQTLSAQFEKLGIPKPVQGKNFIRKITKKASNISNHKTVRNTNESVQTCIKQFNECEPSSSKSEPRGSKSTHGSSKSEPISSNSEPISSKSERGSSKSKPKSEPPSSLKDNVKNNLPAPVKKNKKKDKRRAKPKKEEENEEKFEEYLSLEDVKKGLADGVLIRGAIRINPKNFRDSYVSNEDSSLSDYYITSVVDRNRALEGDEVVLKIKPESEWVDGKPTATVAYIENRVHSRVAVGFIKPLIGNRTEYAMFCPRDKRLPLVRLPPVCWPAGFKNNSKAFESVLFLVKIVEWTKPTYAMGTVVEKVGIIGDLKVETKAILREFGLDITPFSPNIIEYLPKSKIIPESEIQKRRDIRGECVFTIDPLTARDLDDAVSVKQLPNGNYEVGVHISDASYYLEEGTELDQIVSKKATTIYLVDNVYHMLPVELCLHCSLLPGEDKLAFSVFWELTEQGEIIKTDFTRTVLNSCTQLAYEHAQIMIEQPDKQFNKSELPSIHNGFTAKNLSDTVNILQKIALNLRQKRIQNGALRIDQTKLLFSLNPSTGEPIDFRVYENKDAHRLIEEFMLLANISVADKINDSFPNLAFLRCHEPPKHTMLRELQSNLATCGMHIDISSSGGINTSIRKYITDDFAGMCRGAVLNHLLAKPMTRAKYFCAGKATAFSHFALSVPIYTHFTSPIRRYADIMVHRLLAASLGYSEPPAWDVSYVNAIANVCNVQKYSAKRAGEASSELYLAHFIEKHQPYVQNCVVVDVKDHSFDAIVLQTGTIVRLYQKTCEGQATWKTEELPTSKSRKSNEKKILKLTVTFPRTPELPEVSLTVDIFTLVKVKLTRKPQTNKIEATLLRPIFSQTFGN